MDLAMHCTLYVTLSQSECLFDPIPSQADVSVDHESLITLHGSAFTDFSSTFQGSTEQPFRHLLMTSPPTGCSSTFHQKTNSFSGGQVVSLYLDYLEL